ncbi:hypothetical protein [Dactylosporangium darangshiense]|uniref:Lipoprotein n=1 Tax=Dactylosporangium darangshiense TaxID=579108 RepID=A0ABP8DW54_9ACTN
MAVPRQVYVVVVAVLALVVSGCGSPGSRAPGGETNPAGDIPDNTAFVSFRPADGRYEIKVPEGWQRTVSGAAVSFTDKLNTIRVETLAAAAAPSVDSAKAAEVPAIQAATRNFALQKVETVRRNAGDAVLIVYRADSQADPVTGKIVPDSVERYEFWNNGVEAVVTLSGPVGADNVDPWRTVTDSLRWLP